MPDLSLDLRYLRYAMIAAEQGSFRRTAEATGVPQSTVSRRILQLEHKLGFSLFDRDYRGVRVTMAGKEFLREATRGVTHFDHAIRAAVSSERGERGEIEIGILPALTSGPLHQILRVFRQRHEKLKVRVREGTAQEQLQGLTGGETDVVIVSGSHSITGYESSVLWCEGVFAALPATHPLAEKDEVEWSDLREEAFIVSTGGPGPEIYDYLIQRLATVGFSPTIDSHAVGRDSLMNLVAMGYGLTLTSTSTLGMAWPDVVFRSISGASAELPVTAIWAKANSNPALKYLLSIAREISAGLRDSRNGGRNTPR